MPAKKTYAEAAKKGECFAYKKGECKRGDACRFSHGGKGKEGKSKKDLPLRGVDHAQAKKAFGGVNFSHFLKSLREAGVTVRVSPVDVINFFADGKLKKRDFLAKIQKKDF
jgi:hypothetical protein